MLIIIGLWLGFSHSAHAQIVASHAAGFTIEHSVELAANAKTVYGTLIKISDWWDPSHSVTGDAKNMYFDLKPGGCWCETLPDGGFVQHGAVIREIPSSMLIFNNALAPLQDLGYQSTLAFYLNSETPGKTILKVRYTALGVFEGNPSDLARIVDGVLNTQVTRFKKVVSSRL